MASEQAGWETYKKRSARPLSAVQSEDEATKDQSKNGAVQEQLKHGRTQHPQRSAPYTQDEKQWLKTHWRSEFHFLQAYGLTIYNEEDREEGRAIARGLMEAEENDEAESQQRDDENAEEDFQGHMTDYLFDETSLDWIEKHYGNSMTFMYSYGLKFYNDDDCAEAQHLVRVLMEGEDELEA